MLLRKRKPLLGRRFGTFKVTRTFSNARCRIFCFSCGRTKTVWKANLPKMQSCGCQTKQLISKRLTQHGHNRRGQRTATYRSYVCMRERCECKTNHRFPTYGGAKPPVRVCSRWRGRNGFENFLADLGERPPNTTLGRFLDLGCYEPGNVKWMTLPEQIAERRKKFLTRQPLRVGLPQNEKVETQR